MEKHIQLEALFPDFDRLQHIYGNPKLNSIYGAGKISEPLAAFVFMNPTARNIAAFPEWQGIRAQWIGTKNVWKMLHKLHLISRVQYFKIMNIKPLEWKPGFAYELYTTLSNNGVYITNMAKCTQDDARPLSDQIFNSYLELLHKEIAIVNPKNIVSFGNQVSSILLSKKISVSEYDGCNFESLKIGAKQYKVYPTYYPVGQGMRNMDRAVERIKLILNQ